MRPLTFYPLVAYPIGPTTHDFSKSVAAYLGYSVRLAGGWGL